jgi:hypothetical protein
VNDMVADAAPDNPAPPVSVVGSKALTAHFKLVFLTTCGFTLMFTIAWLAMAIVPAPTASVIDATGGCRLFAGSGFGAILGLIGGKIS